MKTRLLTLLIMTNLLVGCSTELGTVGPPTLVDTGVDPDSWARIPAGPYLAGLHAHPAETPMTSR